MSTLYSTPLTLAGLGIGPFNMSVAALADQYAPFSTRFFDKRINFAWHPGLLLHNAQMQTSFLKDLVTAVAPESRYSFLAYLVKHKRFYRFLSTQQNEISRQEFSNYLAWVSRQLNNVQFDTAVEKVEFKKNAFTLTTTQGTFKAKHLCLGTGKRPYIPEGFEMGEDCFHASEIGLRSVNMSGKRIAIIGGGQTGADVLLNSLQNQWGEAKSIHWISRRSNFQPLDEAAFTNEFFTPDYIDRFYCAEKPVRQQEVAHQKLTSDGITQACLLAIYRELYQRFEVEGHQRNVHLMPHRQVSKVSLGKQGYQVLAFNGLTGETEHYRPDIVVLATGFESFWPECMEPLNGRIDMETDTLPALGKHFDVSWDGSHQNRIYAVNAGLISHGIADPQLSLMAWRSATILNHLSGRSLFDLKTNTPMIDWGEKSIPSNPQSAIRWQAKCG